MGAGLLGFLGILVQHLLTQNSQRHDEHVAAMDAIAAQGRRNEELHREAMNAIGALDREHREHREKLHTETMAQVALLSERTAVLETKIAMPGPAGA